MGNQFNIFGVNFVNWPNNYNRSVNFVWINRNRILTLAWSSCDQICSPYTMNIFLWISVFIAPPDTEDILKCLWCSIMQECPLCKFCESVDTLDAVRFCRMCCRLYHHECDENNSSSQSGSFCSACDSLLLTFYRIIKKSRKDFKNIF